MWECFVFETDIDARVRKVATVGVLLDFHKNTMSLFKIYKWETRYLVTNDLKINKETLKFGKISFLGNHLWKNLIYFCSCVEC